MRILYILLLLLLFYFSSYRMTGENVAFGVYGAYLTFLLLLISPILFRVKRLEYNKTLTILVCLFTFTTAVSAFFNSEVGLVIQSLLFLCLFLSTTVVTNSYFKETIGKTVTVTLLLAHLPIIIIPLITDGIESFPYRGIFNNPNSFGIVSVTIFTIFVAILFSKIEKALFYKNKPSKINLLIYLTLATFSFLLVIISSSRTSFLAGIISILVGLSSIILFSIKHNRITNLVLKTLVSLPLLAGLYLIIAKLTPMNLYIQESILNKFDRKSDDLLDGRGYSWSKTIEDASLFGNGENYFDNIIGLGAHNTFIHILGVYGWIPMILFSLFFLISLLYCIRFILYSNHDYKYLPLMILLTFLALSMGENMMYKITMVVAFILIGFVANKKKVIITS